MVHLSSGMTRVATCAHVNVCIDRTASAIIEYRAGTFLVCYQHHFEAKIRFLGRHTMMDRTDDTSAPTAPIPADDPRRMLVIARPDEDQSLPHVGVVGDTYTILLSGDDTAGRYCLIDMHVPPGGGPPPHRHDFEEMFTILDGEIELTFRGAISVARTGDTVNIPANAPHQFKNVSSQPARLLCICSPAGQEAFFLAIGQQVETRTTPLPPLDDAARAALMERTLELAPRYRSELLLP